MVSLTGPSASFEQFAMPKFDHYFLPLDPPPSSKAQLDALNVIWSCVVHHPNAVEPVCVRYIGTQHYVQVIAITLPKVERDNEHIEEWFKQIFETSITALRLTTQSQATPIYGPIGFMTAMVQNDDPEPNYSLVMENKFELNRTINGQHIGSVFEFLFCKPFSSAASLFAESQLCYLPPHYRLLSLVRALELLYPNESERKNALSRFETQFASLGISERPFKNALHEIRASCAHGVPNGRKPPKAFVGIGYGNGQLHALIGLLTLVVSRAFQVIHGLPFEGAPPIPE